MTESFFIFFSTDMYSYKYSFCLDLRRFVCLSFVSYSLFIGFLELQFKNVLRRFCKSCHLLNWLANKKKAKTIISCLILTGKVKSLFFIPLEGSTSFNVRVKFQTDPVFVNRVIWKIYFNPKELWVICF